MISRTWQNQNLHIKESPSYSIGQQKLTACRAKTEFKVLYITKQAR